VIEEKGIGEPLSKEKEIEDEDSRDRVDIEGIAFTWPYVVFRNFRKLEPENPVETGRTLTLIELNMKH
jgi:hypothetical protein